MTPLLSRRAFCGLTACLPSLLVSGCRTRERNQVVLSCAQDREFAEGLLADYQQITGETVAAKYDTEANKSVSLVEELLRERERPRVDVFWNNEVIGTIRLQRAGVLTTHNSPNANDFPDWTRAKDGTWQAFAARARVLVVNTNLLRDTDRPTSIYDLIDPKRRGQGAMAKPFFGTTATHAACLFAALGTAQAEAFFRGIKANAVRLVAGNKQVARQVAAGEVAFGLTDTDDAILEVEAGRPVTLIFPDADGRADLPNLGTLYLPNTLALIRNSPNPEGGRRLFEYLLRPQTEQRLAEGLGRQLPLNPQVRAQLHPLLKRPTEIKVRMNVDFQAATDRWEECQAFLRSEFGT